MQLVYKCDHCPDTNKDSTIIEAHEVECSFNPKNKTCYTCNNEYEAGYPMGGHETGCKLKLNTNDGERIGNCKGWELEKN